MRTLLLLFLFTSPLIGSTPRSLSFNGAPQFFDVGPTQYATDDAGNTIAVWSVSNGQNTVLQFAYKPVNSEWRTPGDPRDPNNVISPFFFSVIDWTLAMDREGNATVVWRVNNGSNTVVQAIYRPFDGLFTRAGDPRFEDNFLNHHLFDINTLPQVGIGKGNVTILWRVFNGFNNVLQTSIKRPIGPFSQPGIPTLAENILNYLSLQPGRFDITSPPLFAVDQDGNTIVAWDIFNDVAQVVQAVVRIVGSPLQPAGNPQFQQNILSPRIYSISSLEQITIGSGNATVFWKRIDQITGNLILQAAFKPKQGPFQKPELA